MRDGANREGMQSPLHMLARKWGEGRNEMKRGLVSLHVSACPHVCAVCVYTGLRLLCEPRADTRTHAHTHQTAPRDANTQRKYIDGGRTVYMQRQRRRAEVTNESTNE